MPDPGKQSQPIPSLLIVEDGDEYFEFFERHLFGYRLLRAFHSAGALEALRRNAVDIIVMDIRFDRTDRRHLLGDAAAVGERHFGRKEDVEQAWTYLANRQGFLISANRGTIHPAQPRPARRTKPLGGLVVMRRTTRLG